MNNRIFLIFLLVTPLIVIIGSTLAFNLGYSPENTKNNGTFFDSYFEEVHERYKQRIRLQIYS